MTKLTVLGAGAWGTALAHSLAKANHDVTLWAFEKDVVDSVNHTQENTTYLKGIPLSANITAMDDMQQAVEGAEAVLSVIPAQFSERLWQQIKDLSVPLIICSKGIDVKSQRFLSDIAADVFTDAPLATLSGPNFAAEIAKGLPAATTLACADEAIGEKLIGYFERTNLRPYLSDDIRGVECAAAIKNVIAIACGVTVGCGMGDSARASVITRGLAEATRFGAAFGAKTETFLGLSGAGDMTLTCNSLQSRNMSLGAELGKGKTLNDIMAERSSVAEGVATAKVVWKMAEERNIPMPICQAVFAILYENHPVDDIVAALLSRPLRREQEVA